MRRADLEITYFKAGGPGGQHRNKTETAVRIKHIPTGLVAQATERRSRAQNLQIALQRLEDLLRKRLRKPKPRKKTRPTRASVERRLATKKLQAAKKQSRTRPQQG